MKRIHKIIIAVVFVLILAIGGVFFAYNNALKPVSSTSETVQFSVEEGMSHQDVVDQLDSQGLIKSKFFTQLFLRFNDYPIIQVNTYELDKNMNLKTIFDIISTGDYHYLVKDSFTVPEGSTIPDIASVIAEKLGITQEEVINKWADHDYLYQLIEQYDFLSEDILNENILYPLEGYLYPETYNVTNVEMTIEGYTSLMLDMMQSVLAEYQDQIAQSGKTIHEFLTFASIVERESLYEEDKPIIAGVFQNRLDIDMPLQSDITVLYALQRTGLDITYEELETDSLYNTYVYQGLPVGPVSSVYKTTIEACLNPTESEYYYFFACEDGTVLYASTLEEHEKNVEENMWY